MNVATIRAQLELVNQEHQNSPDVLEAMREATQALESNARIAWPDDWQDCVRWSAADAGWYGRGRFRANCSGWAAELKARLLRLASQLRVAGDDGRAEVIASIADEAETSRELAQEVTGDASDWWSNTPAWTRYGLLAVVLLVAKKAVD